MGLKKMVQNCDNDNFVQAGWRSGGPDERGGGGRFDREYTNGVGGGPGGGPPANPRWKQDLDYGMGRGRGRGGHHGGFGSRPPPGSRYGRDMDNLPEWATSDDPGVERGGSFDDDGKFKAGGRRTLSGGEKPRQSSKSAVNSNTRARQICRS